MSSPSATFNEYALQYCRMEPTAVQPVYDEALHGTTYADALDRLENYDAAFHRCVVSSAETDEDVHVMKEKWDIIQRAIDAYPADKEFFAFAKYHVLVKMCHIIGKPGRLAMGKRLAFHVEKGHLSAIESHAHYLPDEEILDAVPSWSGHKISGERAVAYAALYSILADRRRYFVATSSGKSEFFERYYQLLSSLYQDHGEWVYDEKLHGTTFAHALQNLDNFWESSHDIPAMAQTDDEVRDLRDNWHIVGNLKIDETDMSVFEHADINLLRKMIRIIGEPARNLVKEITDRVEDVYYLKERKSSLEELLAEE